MGRADSHRSSDPRKRLPPPVLSRRKKRTSPRPKPKWYRHLPWLIPVAACVVFGVLIGGSLAIRQVVIVLREPSQVENGEAESSSASVTGHGGHATAGSDLESATSADAELLASSEPDYEVLPPRAAQVRGRKLRKMLLVGTHPEMFPTLAAALEVAIDQDIIEIRTNGTLVIDPQQSTWMAGDGTLTIRTGGGFRPVLTRRAGGNGPMMRMGDAGSKAKSTVFVDGLTFVDAQQPEPNGTCIIYTHCNLTVRRCIFCFNNVGLLAHHQASPETELRVEDSYFYGARQLGNNSAVVAGRARVSMRNNLIVEAKRAMNIGGGIDPTLSPQVKLHAEHNTIVNCPHTLFVYAKANVEIRDNLIAWRSYGYGLGSRVVGLEEAQARINYQGTNNLYHGVVWTVWQGHVPATLAGWQTLTHNGEQNALLTDPTFANPQLSKAAEARLLPPEAFALNPGSPAGKAASDGLQVGADLSRIPAPSAEVEKMIARLSATD